MSFRIDAPPPDDHTMHRTLSRMHSHTTEVVALQNSFGADITRRTSKASMGIKNVWALGSNDSLPSPTGGTTDECDPEPAFTLAPSLEAAPAPAVMLSYEDSMAAVSDAKTAQDLAVALSSLTAAIETMSDAEVQAKEELKVAAFTSLMKSKKDGFDYFSTVEYNTSCRPKVNQLMKMVFDKHSEASAPPV